MGGKSSNKSTAQQQGAAPAATPAAQPLLASYGGGIDPAIQAQLSQAGLLSSVSPTDYYRPVQIPSISRPSEIAGYLQSLGLTPATTDTAAGAVSSSAKNTSPMSALWQRAADNPNYKQMSADEIMRSKRGG